MDAVHWSPVLKQNWRRETAGRTVRHFSQFQFGGLASPFLLLAHFKTLGPVFPPHPHAGFSAVTYMAERSPGGFLRRDSLGNESEIKPGDLSWTLAASGLVLEETPLASETAAEGFQIFVNLKEKNKELRPIHHLLSKGSAPRVRTPSGAEVKVCAGNYLGAEAPFSLPEETDLFDVAMGVGASFPLSLRTGSGGLIYAVEGSFTVDCDEPFSVTEGGAVAFRVKDPTEVTIRALEAGRLLFCQGEVTDEPVVFQGPFAMTSEEAIRAAIDRYQTGAMGSLKPRVITD